MNVVQFDPMRGFARPCFVLSSPGRLKTGERYFTIDLLPAEPDGRGQVGMWDGTDYAEGMIELLWLRCLGETVHDLAGGAA